MLPCLQFSIRSLVAAYFAGIALAQVSVIALAQVSVIALAPMCYYLSTIALAPMCYYLSTIALAQVSVIALAPMCYYLSTIARKILRCFTSRRCYHNDWIAITYRILQGNTHNNYANY